MRTSLRASLALAVALPLSACSATEGEPPILEQPDTEDTLAEFRVIPDVVVSAPISELSEDGDLVGAVTVAYGPARDGEPRDAVVSGTLVELPAAGDEITIDLDQSWNPLAAGFRFYLFSRPAKTGDAYAPVTFDYPGRSVTFELYRDATLLLSEGKLRTDPQGDGFSVDFHDELPRGERDYAVFVVPQFRLFRSLEGTHEYRLRIRCDGTACR